MAQISNGESGLSARNKLNEVIDKIEGNSAIGNDLTITGNLSFGDGDKAIFGDDNDLQIYHDGSNSRIQDTATGSLILSGTNFYVNNTGDSKSYIAGLAGGTTPYVRLYYDGSTRLDTTLTGIDVTGTVTADGLTVNTTSAVTASFSRDGTDGDAVQIFNGAVGTTKALGLGVDGTHGTINSQYGGVKIQPGGTTSAFFGTGNDISFYDSAGTTAKMVWKAADERLGIGTSSPTTALDARGGVNSAHATFTGQASRGLVISTANTLSNDDGVIYNAQTASSGKHIFQISGTEAMRIDSSANVNLTGLSNGRLNFAGGNTSGGSKIQAWNDAGNANGYLAIEGYSSEYARFNPSGDLLVNTIASQSGIAKAAVQFDSGSQYGLEIKDAGIGTTGTFSIFYRGSTVVGSIGVAGGRLYIGSDDTSIFFDSGETPSLRPHGPANPDGVIDIGEEGYRFKDLYLSNAVVQAGIKQTTAATTQVVVETFAYASHDGAKVVITAATSADTYVTELLIATNGTTAVATEYGQIGTGSALATYDVDISGADVRILATPASTTSTTFRVAMTLT
jgi:hypothetical protein